MESNVNESLSRLDEFLIVTLCMIYILLNALVSFEILMISSSSCRNAYCIAL